MHEVEAAPEGWERWRAMAKVQGTRKPVRKWREERAFVEILRSVGDCLNAKDEAPQAGTLHDEWWKWQHRLDRRDFDGPALLGPEANKIEREFRKRAPAEWEAKKVAAAAEAA